MAKAQPAFSDATLAKYEALVATNPRIQRKGASMPYTSHNGHMFSFLSDQGKLALRLPADEREKFLKKFRTKLCEQHGVVMKEYVAVPDSLLNKTRDVKKYFDASFAYVASLKPKPTKRKSTAAKPKSTATKAAKKKTAKKKRRS